MSEHRDPFDGMSRDEAQDLIFSAPLPWDLQVRVWRPDIEGEGAIIKHSWKAGELLPEGYADDLFKACGYPDVTVRIKMYRPSFSNHPVYHRQQTAVPVSTHPTERVLDLWNKNKGAVLELVGEAKAVNGLLEQIGGALGRGIGKEAGKEIRAEIQKMFDQA